MNDEIETKPFGRSTCHICGSVDFEWGNLLTDRGEHTYYVNDDRTRMQKFLGSGMKVVRVRCCLSCHNMQFFTAPTSKRKDE
jgi:hypothetical protein